MNGFNSGEAEVDWLISPMYDLSTVTSPTLMFDAAWLFGTNDETHSLTLLYSEDYDGNTANIGTATWTEIAFDLPPQDTWTEIGMLDISAITGSVYFAFAYNYPDNYTRWRIDNFQLLGFPAAGTDATLSDLQIDGQTIDGFEAAKTSYVVELAAGTTTVPTITYTTTDANATASDVPASDLAGDAAARTSTVTVTAQDGTTTQDYTVTFNPILEVATVQALRASLDETRKYRITGELLLSYQQSFRNKKYLQDGTGGVLVDDDPGIITTTYAVGDGITGLEGSVEIYRGNLQLHPTIDPGAATSSGNTITPVVATVAQLKADRDMYQSTLVTLENVTIGGADGSAVFENGKNYDIFAPGPDTMELRTEFYSTTLTGTVIPDSANVTGIVIHYFDAVQIAPRLLEDVEELVPFVPSTDATLSGLMVDGVSVDGFSPALLSYNVTLASDYSGLPAVTADASDENATVNVDPVTDLSGDAAARTATITVTAEDGTTTKTYTIEFTLAVGISNDLFGNVSIYPVPASTLLYVQQAESLQTLTVYSITGTAVMQLENAGSELLSLDVSDLEAGLYMLKMENEKGSAVVRFLKQ
jgi:hypothetical protein